MSARSQLEHLGGGETVLVVEDSAPVRQLVERYLTRLGYQVLCATEWAQALALCEQHPEPIDLLLTDLILPDVDGLEVARRAKAIRPELRVLYMSGFAGSKPSQNGTDAFPLLEKPFTPSSLLQAVRQILDAPAQ